jgi:hypothetical protein
MNKRWLNVVIVLGLMALSGIYGFMINRNHLFPYEQLRQVYTLFHPKPTESAPEARNETEELNPAEKALYEKIAPLYTQTDVAQLISINTPEEALERRQQLIDLLWGELGLPQRQPDEVKRGVPVSDFTDEDNLQRVDRLIVKMDFGLDSVVYHYIPKDGNGKLVFWHEGHDEPDSSEYIRQFLDKGYAVLTFFMPLYGENSKPVVFIPRLGNIQLTFQDYFVFLEPENGHPVKYFMEPIVVGLNYIEQEYDYDHIAMTGYSGGGWSTTLAAAIDPRIQSSFPVAGSYPIFLREYRDRSHYEHQLPELYTLANFLELYVLGGYGEGRMQMQILNQYDPCCYAGIKGELYRDEVSARVKVLGAGSWELFIDPYDQHGISPAAFE